MIDAREAAGVPCITSMALPPSERVWEWSTPREPSSPVGDWYRFSPAARTHIAGIIHLHWHDGSGA